MKKSNKEQVTGATIFFPERIRTLVLGIADVDVRFWAIAVTVFIEFIAIMGIGAWIGWTMATTPPQNR
jgi:hypothetical protein